MALQIERILDVSPALELPDPTSVLHPVPSKLLDRIRDAYVGLKTISCRASLRDDKNAKHVIPVFTLSFRDGGDNKVPVLTVEQVANLIAELTLRDAKARNAEVTYSGILYSHGERKQKKQLHWTLKVNGTGAAEPVQDGEDESTRGDGVHMLRTATPRFTLPDEPLTTEGALIQALAVNAEAHAGVYAEQRANMESFRTQTVIAVDELSRSRMEDNERVFTRLENMVERLASELEKEREFSRGLMGWMREDLAQQRAANASGMQMWVEGYRMQAQALQERYEWSTALMVAEGKNKEPSIGRMFFRELMPIVTCTAGLWLEHKGVDTKKIGEAFKKLTDDDDDDDDEDDDDEDESTKKSGIPKRGKKVLDTTAKAEPTLVQRVGLFRGSLSEETKAKMREILPALAWSAIERAFDAKLDQVVFMAMLQLRTSLQGHDEPAVKAKLAAVLSPEQTKMLLELQQVVESRMKGRGTGQGARGEAKPKVVQVRPTPPSATPS